MNGMLDCVSEVKLLSPEDGHYFFGYYDLNAYDSTGTRHLCHRVPFADRIPGPQDVAELGILSPNGFQKIAETTAWNFQQGALLQFHGTCDDIVYYNERVGGTCVTAVHNLKTGRKRQLPRPAACISPNGKYALSINFGRIFDFRPGYGYAGLGDPFAAVNRPEEDGVFLMDTETGHCRQIIDYARLFREFPIPGLEGEKLVINHITFNETSDRFLFLLRNFPGKSGAGWGTTLITSDLQGNMQLLLRNKFVSHYCWKNSRQILAFCAPEDTPGLFLLDDPEGSWVQLRSPYPEGPSGGDIHCLFSPDKRYILGDGYRDRKGYRPLFLYDTQTETVTKLLRSFSTMDAIWDIRCDLHARFDRQGKKISFDSTHDGRRHICQLEL